MDKREAIENIPPEAWLQRKGAAGYFSLWDLHPKWMKACFDFEYQRVYRDTDPSGDQAGNFGFLRQDASYEILVFSRRATLSCYEFSWVRGGAAVQPQMNGQPCPNATVSMAPNDPGAVVLRNPALDETITLNLETLESGSAQARAAREAAAVEPWRRVFTWYTVVRANDPETYMRRLHQTFRQFLETVPSSSYAQEHIQYFQSQRLLPDVLPDIGPENMPQIVADIKAQQRCFNSPQAGQVPRIFRVLDADRLEPVDAQALIMMGAVKELMGFVDREMAKLGQTNPEIKKLWNTPNGRAQIMQHPAVLALMQHPQAQKEQQENMEKAMRTQGAMSGNLADVDMMLANQKMMQMWSGMMPMSFGNAPMPAWQLYKPFDPTAPQTGTLGGFDLGGVVKKLGF
jgi:hypothetical protein